MPVEICPFCYESHPPEGSPTCPAVRDEVPRDERTIWESHEGGTGDACDECGEEMPVNMMTALFGVHFKCTTQRND